MITSEEIKRRLWDGATELRGSMDASRYKDYMLGLMFYKFLSDKTLETFRERTDLGQVSEADLLKEYTEVRREAGEDLDSLIQTVLGYFIKPEYLYQTWIKDINSGDFEVQKVIDSFSEFERSIFDSTALDDFKGIFSSSSLDLTDSALGNLHERNKNIKALIMLFADLNMVALQKGDVLGDAYEYLIGQFAMESGKKAGEFYTPRQVSEVMAQIAAKTSDIKSIYDPTVGSGSLLLTVKKHLGKDVQRDLCYYGQEKNTATYNLSRINLLIHGVRPEKMTIKNGDTLSQDWPEDPSRPNEGVLFDAVVMNPPYSAKNWNKSDLKASDPRFEVVDGVLPPDSKGDFAFLLHGLYHLGSEGTMAIVLPHGVLFRGSSEGEIRKRLLAKERIDAIIGLPSNLFTNTGIPVCILVLKKNRPIGAPVLVIDASKSFIKVGKQNVLQEKDIAKIVDTYVNRSEILGYSHLATREEIIKNEFNMNIPRYVEAVDEEIPQDIDAHLYGGIPKANIDNLKILNAEAEDVVNSALSPVRDGYYKLEKPINELTDEVLSDSHVVKKSENIKSKAEEYILKYWNVLRKIDNVENINSLMEEMLNEIKDILSNYDFIDVYDGYQVIAEIWKNNLTHDTELIAGKDFYTVGRTREPNMVTKGTGNKKREEQDGWVGAIVPNDLIAKRLYSNELQAIEDKKSRIAEIDKELAELVEAAKTEDSDENLALYDALKKNEDDEPQDSFDKKAVKADMKKATKKTIEYELLKKVDGLMNEKSDLNKEIKAEEKELKEAIFNRILKLTNEEIDELVYEKWFGTTVNDIVKLVEIPLKNELATLEMLDKRYENTLADIDDEINKLESSFEALMSELVVM